MLLESCAVNLLWMIWTGPWLKNSFASPIQRRGVNAGLGATRAPHGIAPCPWHLPLQVSTSSHVLLTTDEWAGTFTPFSFLRYSFQIDYFHMIQNSKDPKIYRVERPSFLSPSIHNQPLVPWETFHRYFMHIQANVYNLSLLYTNGKLPLHTIMHLDFFFT